MKSAVVLAALLAVATASIYIDEKFNGELCCFVWCIVLSFRVGSFALVEPRHTLVEPCV